MARTRVGRVAERHVGHGDRARKNAKHRERWRGVRESIGSDQSIKRNRKRRERQERRR